MPPEKWKQIDRLFDRVLDSEDPGPIDLEPDTEVAEAVRRLWGHHLAAKASGFLEKPATMVRNLLDRVSTEHDQQSPARAFSDGDVLAAGRFLIESLLGEGGMGQVYLARDRKLEKPVALKTIRPALAGDAAIRARFIGEIRSAQSVTHPNVCRINDLIEDGDAFFCSMEYLQGATLEVSRIAPDSDHAKAIALQLAEGLHAAHSNGIVHRDFKPQNVILVPPARAVITDFGLARPVADTGDSSSDATADGSLRGAGTRNYMAPELLRGEAASIRSDIFAFGKVLAQLLPSSKWAGQCAAERAEDRPESLAPVIEDLLGEPGLSRRTLLMGAGLAAVGLGGTAYGVFQSRRARFPLTPTRHRLILNGLQARGAAGDRALTLRQLLIAGLRQSPLLGVLPDERLLAVLRRLRLPANLPMTLGDLFAVAQAERAAVVVDGSLEKAARGLRILLRVFEPGARAPTLELTRAVDDERQMVRLAQEAAMELRSEFAESDQSLQASSAPLEQVTSSSPEAVDLYFRAVREYELADVPAALAYLDRAIAIDPQFALAHLYRAQALRGLARGKTALESAEKAYALRGRVSDRERNWIDYFYHDLRADVESSLAAIRKNAVLFPEEPQFQRFTAAALCRLGRFREAWPLNRAAVDLDEFGVHNLGELVTNLAEGNAAEEAIAAHDEFRRKGVTHPVLENGNVIALLLRDRFDAAGKALDPLVTAQTDSRWTGLLMAAAAVLQGRLLHIVNTLEGDLVYDAMSGEDRYLHHRMAYAAYIRLLMGQPEAARRHIRGLTSFDPLPSAIYPLRVGLNLAASNGFQDEAARALIALTSLATRWPSTQTRGALAHGEAAMLTAKGDRAAAWNRLREAKALWADPLTLFSVLRHAAHPSFEDPNEAIRAAASLDALRGKTIKSYFPGLIVMTELERARSLARLSLFDGALRAYKRVAFHWDSAADHLPVMREARFEMAALAERTKR